MEKRFACADCGARFVEATKLSRHRLLHSGARLHQCPHCTYAAADAFRLKRHIRTHTGEKPYECRVCRMRYDLKKKTPRAMTSMWSRYSV